MKLNTVHKILTVLLLAGPLAGNAQDGPLDELIATALRQNQDLQTQRLVENERLIGVELARASRQPTVDLKSEYLFSVGGRRLSFPIGDLLNPAYGTLNALTQSNQFPTDLENVDEGFLPNNFHDTRFEVRYPLVQPLINRETALREAQTLEAREQTRILEQQLRGQIRDLYYAVQQSREGQNIIAQSRTVLEELLRVNRSLVQNDLRTREVVSRTEAEIATLDAQLAQLEAQERIAVGALNRLLDRPLNTPLNIPPNPMPPPLPVDPQILLDSALRRRPEFMRLDAGDRTLVALDALQAAGAQPTLGAFLNAGAQGFLGGDLSDHPYATAGLGFSWSLYDGKKRNLNRQITAVQRQQLGSRRSAAVRGVELEIWQHYQTLLGERAQFSALETGTRAAETALDVIRAKYRNQNALLVEYLDAQNQLTRQQLEMNLSRWRMWQAYAALLTATGE